MNDRPTSGQYPDMGYDGLSTTTFAGDQAYVSYETQGQGYQFVTDYTASGSSGTYDSYGGYSGYPSAADTGAYDSTAWTAPESYLSSVPAQTVPEDTTGSWDASAWNSAATEYQPSTFGYDSTGTEQTGHWTLPGYGQDTGTYDATAWNGGAAEETTAAGYEATTVVPVFTETPEAVPYAEADAYAHDETSVFEPVAITVEDEPGFPDDAVHDLPTQAMPVTPATTTTTAPRSARRATGKNAAKAGKAGKAGSGGNATAGSRRRSPAKRSALLTVAVPSACVMGVAGVAAASVGGLTAADKPAEETTTVAAPDPASVKPVEANNKLDTQLAALSADAGDFADRASRTQERIDLKQRQEEDKKKRAEEAAAKEAARPKFAVPVAQRGLSAGFGQAGGMWMSVHTGIDFPVSYGTPVMAATDGTVRTQWNSAYGNMAIVTSPDGTETWYCHLSSTKIRSGKVKAGEVIAYSGNSGNSTGPHLHFEVRPGGGSAVDPQAWLRSHGLDAT
ncbi:M23 family metallopeptidase [Streptomyces sp. NBC_00091]|uniref:M23 family metallopeptidase n=1 Tax=Streptomyces sp. NBC_00091 TaxID=2975648 RepID=UPI00224E4987|nr:M23 family metallopeptidase [Streptomyces sp. NBC_00091]MCX5376413.1 M23 family metallopeptidase [Streptomyces sp. NBC_00091]